MASRPTITLARGGNTITIGQPWFGYTSTINMPFTIEKLSNGTYATYDPSSTCDVRQCQCTLYLDSTDHAAFTDFMGDATKGRGRDDIVMTLPTGSGFFPFGPDKGDVGAFTVAISPPDYQGIVESPYKYFMTEIVITNTGSYPSYTPPAHTDLKEGSWTFGTITDLRMPQGLFSPTIHTAFDTQITRGGAAMALDRAIGGDWEETEFTWELNEAKAAAICAYITGTSRAAGFNIIPGADYYPFGYVAGNSTITCRLIQNVISITHDRHNQFTFDLRLAYIS